MFFPDEFVQFGDLIHIVAKQFKGTIGFGGVPGYPMAWDICPKP